MRHPFEVLRSTPVNTPLTVRTREGIHLAVHEAALVDHPAMTLKQDARGVYRTDLVPWADGTRVKCVGALRTGSGPTAPRWAPL